MRLIDADRLVKTIEKAQMEGLKVNVLSLINDAPTVDDRYDEGYAKGYVDGSTEADEERPKGKWENTIPENPTNGDMLLTMFDAATVYGIDKENDCIAICMDNNFYQKFRYSWWNAPYKRGEEA